MGTTLELSELNTKIGQVFMAGMPGISLDQGTEALIRDYNIGGLILFDRNIQDPVQVARLCRDIQALAMEHHGFPLMLAVDQEGGRVARLGKPFTLFPGNSAMGQDPHPEERAVEFARVTGREMRLVGLNMNLAPVMDVQRGDLEDHLVGRTFGEDPGTVARLGEIVIRTLQENRVMAVAKHFPGLGRAGIDPHVDLPTIAADMEEIRTVNLPPFQAAIDARVTGIMSSHSLYPALDPEHPATLSPLVMTALLREQMGFDGLILSDDLEMGAIAKQWGVAAGALKAFEAGVDVLLICKDQKHVLETLALMRGRILREKTPHQRLQQAFEKIAKIRKRLLDSWEGVSIPKVMEYFRGRPPGPQ